MMAAGYAAACYDFSLLLFLQTLIFKVFIFKV